jgi:DNA-binding NarL/FixJ family response regulator
VGSKSIEVVAEAEEKRTTVKLAQKLLPDVVVIDISMPA